MNCSGVMHKKMIPRVSTVQRLIQYCVWRRCFNSSDASTGGIGVIRVRCEVEHQFQFTDDTTQSPAKRLCLKMVNTPFVYTYTVVHKTQQYVSGPGRVTDRFEGCSCRCYQ